MRRRLVAPLLCFALLGGWAASTRPAAAEDAMAPWAPPMLDAAGRFAAAWSSSSGASVQAMCTPPLWNRLAARFAGAPAPGALGRMEVVRSCDLVKPDVGRVHLLCVHPDGVQDVVTITLVNVAGQWRIAGGPCGMTG